MFLRRFAAVCAASSCFMALRPYHRPGMLAALRVLPTTACDMTASIRHFVSTVPLASVATAVSRASITCINKSKRQPPAPPTAGRSPTNNGRQPCNFTQEKLIELLERNSETPKYSLYFFNGTQTDGHAPELNERFNIDSKDFYDRCNKCGMTIDEHHASTSTVIIKATADDILRAAKGHFEFKVPPEANRRRIGRGGFDTEVHENIGECAPTTNQKSKALVLMSASGVGKTFATMTFRACSRRMSPRPPYECLTIYLGLNQGWALTSQELAFMDAVKKGKGFHEVECVLLQRLLIALDVTLTKCQGDLSRLNEVGHDGQKIPLPRDAISTVQFFNAIDVDSVKGAICERLGSLVDLCPRKGRRRLVVLVALDEAQLLDDSISPCKKGGGARYGLRVLRQLQVLAYKETKRQCLLLPIATGIRPTVSLSSRTEGENTSVGQSKDDAAHVSEGDFRTIVRNHIKKLRRRTKVPVGKVVTLLSTAFYPCVRNMLEWKVGSAVKAMEAKLEITANIAVSILLADFARTSTLGKAKKKELASVELDSIPHQIPVSRIDGSLAQPLVHFFVFKPLYDRITNDVKGGRALPTLSLDTIYIGDRFAFFELRMFQVFGLFMSIFCDPRAPTEKFRTIVHPRIEKWLPKDAWKLEARSDDVEESKFHYLPFAKHTNHKDACKGPIFKRVLSTVQNLRKDCGCWMCFGGEAPVDYMLFVRRGGNRMEVRYGDAKHYTLRKKDPKAEKGDGLAAASCKGVTPYDASLEKKTARSAERGCCEGQNGSCWAKGEVGQAWADPGCL